MEQDKKNVINLIVTMIIYILLSTLGVFNSVGSVLFPILALPFAFYCIRNKTIISFHIIFHIIISIAVYIATHSIAGIAIYMISAVIPAYIILFLYRCEIALPNMMMYGGLSLAGVIFVFFAVMKQLGMDFEVMFGKALDQANNEFIVTLDSMAKISAASGKNMVDLQASITQIKDNLNMTIDMIKAFYAAIIVTQIVICFAIMLIIVNAMIKRKISGIPTMGQLLEFRVSKVAVLLLVGCMLLADINGDSSGALLVYALNLMCFLANLLEIAGALGLIALLRRTSINQGFKVLGYIGIVILFMISPYMLMFFGCLDAIFNYRKVTIVV